ncbi:MAG TPA: type II secretion system F family protein [archaeon]|nr:type II secretion system F family protein [archaeon]
MNEPKIPFSPLPGKVIYALAKRLRGPGAKVAKLFPFLKTELRQAELDFDESTYGAIMIVLSGFYFLFAASVGGIFAYRLSPQNLIPASLGLGILFALLILAQLAFYPKIILKKKVRDVERNLVFALRTILIEIKSGVTLFDSINIVAEGDNGQVSKEFKKAVEKIETGYFQNEALEEMGENNPSLYFRRTIWQLVNGLKAGSDLSTIMESLVKDLTREKENQVRKYGNSLKLLSLLYMMLGAIIPSLGLTFLIILSTFPQIKISQEVFWGMLAFIGLGQFMFLGIIKSARPTLLGD